MAFTKEFIQNLRQEYKTASLYEETVATDPISQFGSWFKEAVDAQLYEPNVMTLATADAEGNPNARIVLLKDFSNAGFSFYSNYLSQKAREMDTNPKACLVFFWAELERQVRIEGTIEKLEEAISNAYFISRPVGSQIGAIASPQSQEIPNKDFLEKRVQQLTEEFQSKPLERPAHWGGYLVKPTAIEFWQGRPSRLHDRLKYLKEGDIWHLKRLAP